MKKLFLSAIAASLVFSGWQASAHISAPGNPYSVASISRPVKKAKKVKKDKAEKKDKNAKKAKKPKKPNRNPSELHSAVAKYLNDVAFFNALPNLDAKYFIYLQSASWCGPCNMEMPNIVQEYKEMKADGRVEIILVGHDQTEDQAVGFLSRYNAEFPGILVTDQKAAGLPGFSRAGGIPNAIIVTAEGKVVYQGHPSSLFDQKKWKEYTKGGTGNR